MIAFARLDPKSVQLEEGFTHDVTGVRHQGSPNNNLRITINNHEDLEKARPLIQRSYDEAG